MRKFVSLVVLVLAFAANSFAAAGDTPGNLGTSTISSTVAWSSRMMNYIRDLKLGGGMKVDDQRKDIFLIGGRLRSFNGLDASQPDGFATTSSDATKTSLEFSLQAKFRQFAVEYLPLANTRRLDTKFYGASLGEIEVATSNVVIGKFFAVDKREWGLSFGLGAENNEIKKGVISMGGFTFPTKVNAWSPVFQIGGWYHLNNRFSLGLDYERSNFRIVTQIPGVPDLNTTYTDRLSARVEYAVL